MGSGSARCPRARAPWPRRAVSSSRSRSSSGAPAPSSCASRMSRSLAARILCRRARSAAAAARRARFFCSLGASSSTGAAARAPRPIASMIADDHQTPSAAPDRRDARSRRAREIPASARSRRTCGRGCAPHRRPSTRRCRARLPPRPARRCSPYRLDRNGRWRASPPPATGSCPASVHAPRLRRRRLRPPGATCPRSIACARQKASRRAGTRCSGRRPRCASRDANRLPWRCTNDIPRRRRSWRRRSWSACRPCRRRCSCRPPWPRSPA